jgi:hypothetical protein
MSRRAYGDAYVAPASGGGAAQTGTQIAELLTRYQRGWVIAESGTLTPSANEGGVMGGTSHFMSATSLVPTSHGVAQRRQYLSAGAWGFTDTQTTQLDANPLTVCKFSLGSGTDLRSFIGFSSSATIGTTTLTDDPAAVVLGVQFSTARPDTNWQIVHKTLSGDPLQVIDSGIAADTSVKFLVFDITGGGTSAVISILDNTGAVEFTTTITTNLPGPTVSLVAQYGMRVLSGSELVDFYYFEHLLRGQVTT